MMIENESGGTEPGQANQQIAELGQDPIRVLHVEDDPNCREAIADQLSDQGFAVRALQMPYLWPMASPSPGRRTSSFSTGTFQTYRASNCSSSCASAG
jgi:hypothetical protein